MTRRPPVPRATFMRCTVFEIKFLICSREAPGPYLVKQSLARTVGWAGRAGAGEVEGGRDWAAFGPSRRRRREVWHGAKLHARLDCPAQICARENSRPAFTFIAAACRLLRPTPRHQAPVRADITTPLRARGWPPWRVQATDPARAAWGRAFAMCACRTAG